MSVDELIRELSNLPPDYIVMIDTVHGDEEVSKIIITDEVDFAKPSVVITFDEYRCK